MCQTQELGGVVAEGGAASIESDGKEARLTAVSADNLDANEFHAEFEE